MKFRKYTTYNTHDTKNTIVNGRIRVEHGTKRRCEIIVRGVCRHGSAGVSLEDLTAHVNGRLNAHYSLCDIRTLANRLVKEEIIIRDAKDHYQASPLQPFV